MPFVQLVLDWDSTLTTKDTLSVFASLCYEARSSKHSDPKPWSCIVDSYIQDYKEHKEKYVPRSDQRKTIEEESAWLASLVHIERRSYMRFKAENTFFNLNHGELQFGVSKALKDGCLIMRPAWNNLLSLCEQAKINNDQFSIAILSVNWSAIFIRQCLQEAAILSSFADQNVLLQAVDSLPIYANELIQFRVGRGTVASPVEGIHTSTGKAHTLGKIRRNSAIMIYAGDSATDFDCLLAADIGICIRDVGIPSSSQIELISIFDRVGVHVKHLSDIPASLSPLSKRNEHTLSTIWWTDDLAEIATLILQIAQGSE
jgi:thiamine phosphate phosphatase / amino-HMP aminohydrolase